MRGGNSAPEGAPLGREMYHETAFVKVEAAFEKVRSGIIRVRRAFVKVNGTCIKETAL
jgi:hypothetical protein